MSWSSSGNGFVVTTNSHKISTLCRSDIITDDQLIGKLSCLSICTYRKTTGTIATQRLGCLILKSTGNIRGEYCRWAQVTLKNGLDQKAIHRETGFTITIIWCRCNSGIPTPERADQCGLFPVLIQLSQGIVDNTSFTAISSVHWPRGTHIVGRLETRQL